MSAPNKKVNYSIALEILKERGGTLSTNELRTKMGFTSDNHVIVLRRKLNEWCRQGLIINMGPTLDKTEGWTYYPNRYEPKYSVSYLAHGATQAVSTFMKKELKKSENVLTPEMEKKLFKTITETLMENMSSNHQTGVKHA